MQDVNSNFLDTDIEEIVEEIEEEVIEETEEAEATTSIINEAIARIEQAKLYEALLNHQLFAPGSARPEIIKAVRKEFKEFIQFRLEVLLGIKADGKPGHTGHAQSIQVKSPFSDEETVALKDIARKLVEKNRLVSSVPSISAVQVPQPQIQELPTVHQHVQVAAPVGRSFDDHSQDSYPSGSETQRPSNFVGRRTVAYRSCSAFEAEWST